jgi:hypothetical protein
MATALLAKPTLSQELSYNYVAFNYLDAGFSNTDYSGFSVEGAKSLTEQFFLLGSYTSITDDFELFDLEQKDYSFGVGFHAPLRENIDFVSSAVYQYSKTESPFGKNYSDGLQLASGIRALVAKRIELIANLRYETVGNHDDTSYKLGVRYFITTKLSFGADYNNLGPALLQAGMRFDF